MYKYSPSARYVRMIHFTCRYLCSTWIIVCPPAFFGDGSTFRCFDWLVDDENVRTKNVQNHLFRSGMYDVCSLLACARVWFFTCTLYQREFDKFASTAVYLVQDNTTLWPRRFDTFRPIPGLSPIPLLQPVPIHVKTVGNIPFGTTEEQIHTIFSVSGGMFPTGSDNLAILFYNHRACGCVKNLNFSPALCCQLFFR